MTTGPLHAGARRRKLASDSIGDAAMRGVYVFAIAAALAPMALAQSPGNTADACAVWAQETGFAPAYVKEAGEYAPGSFLSSAFSNRMFGPTNEDILWEHQYKVITDLAAKGPCVIVGRCADYILQGTADCLKVFIHADLAFRAHRIVEVYGQREQSPEERLRDKDKRRAAYHRFYTDMKWGYAQNYHLTLDSGVIGIDRCADIIAQLY